MKKDPRAPLFYGMSRRAPRTPGALPTLEVRVEAGEAAGLQKHTNSLVPPLGGAG